MAFFNILLGGQMSHSADEQALIGRYDARYRLDRSPLLLEVERAVLGCDYGATSYTTRDQAERIGRWLELGPGVRLLDVGAGSGWPGLFLARTTGCDVALLDVPMEGLRTAARRLIAEPIAGEGWLAVGDGAALPFRSGWFDALSHSDVLC